MSALSPGRAHYLDPAATTPMVAAAVDEMRARLGDVGNASSLHASGRRARRLVEEAREQVAGALGARPSEVVFTAGGTEADNLAIKGLFWARGGRRRVLTTAVEHHAVLDPVDWLARHEGAEVSLLPVDAVGAVRLDALNAVLERDPGAVALLSCMWVNNEVGTVHPLGEVTALAHAYGVPVHTDAVQTVGHLPVDLVALEVDAISISGHKVGGPQGVGALLVRRELDLVPLLHGGGQERDLRSGTADVAGIRAFAVAVEQAVQRRPTQAPQLRRLRDSLVTGIRSAVPDAVLNGPAARAGEDARAPGIAHLTFPGCDGDALLMLLDAQGIECSTGSACTAGVPQPSHVLLAMGADDAAARGSLRFSLGHDSTQDDVDAAVAAIGPVVERARTAGLAAAAGRR
ncbi:MAG: cysteine desulfurase [Actinomycetota bacterium]|nr:cysteine desulfurase [Actinomycetota bacterium]